MLRAWFAFLGLVATVAAGAGELEIFARLSDEKKIEYLTEQTHVLESEAEVARFLSKHPKFEKAFLATGRGVVDTWWDTILEGDYGVEGEPEIQVRAIYVKGGKLFGAQALASQPAVLTVDEGCAYDEAAKLWSEECYKGFISEFFYVDANGTRIDSDDYAEFDH